MSAKIMGKAWEMDLPANKLLVLLAMADHADHNGDNVFPGMALIAYKTGYSERQVKRIVAALVKDGILVEHKGRSKYGTKMYSINLDAGNAKPPYQSDKMSHSHSDNLTPSESDNMSLHEIESDKVTLPQSDILSTQSDIAVSPKPSIEPSNKEQEKSAQPRNPQVLEIALMIKGDVPSDDTIKAAIAEHGFDNVKRAVQKGINKTADDVWKYANGTLEGWKRDAAKTSPSSSGAVSPSTNDNGFDLRKVQREQMERNRRIAAEKKASGQS